MGRAGARTADRGNRCRRSESADGRVAGRRSGDRRSRRGGTPASASDNRHTPEAPYPGAGHPFASRAPDEPPLPPGLGWLDVAARAGGSNSFVVAATRSATGRPLLANDPHLAVEMPSIWYEVHVVAAGLDVTGVTLPSTPFVIIGHNARLAWGLTNTGLDVQDFYVEDVDMTRRQYLYRGQWLPLRSTSVDIGVRGQAPTTYEYFSTRHGPLLYTEAEWETPHLPLSRGK